jgi:hypothetical protein
VPFFWHNPTTGLCEPFVYGGCDGNENRYESRDACFQACSKVDDDWGECANDSDCTMASATCCEPCEPVASEQLVAVNFGHLQRYQSSLCSKRTACSSCAYVDVNNRSKKFFKPVCQNKHCTLVDIRESPTTECGFSDDCMIRAGAGCCPQCDNESWVAVNRNVDLCGGTPLPCAACAPPAPNRFVGCAAGRCWMGPAQ